MSESTIQSAISALNTDCVEFPNGEYYCLAYNEEKDALELGEYFSLRFDCVFSVEYNHNLDFTQNYKILYNFATECKPELLCTNTQDWFYGLSENDLVMLWNFYLEKYPGRELDKVYSAEDIDEIFPSTLEMLYQLSGQTIPANFDWWGYKRNGFIKLIENIKDKIDMDELENWATDPTSYHAIVKYFDGWHDLGL